MSIYYRKCNLKIKSNHKMTFLIINISSEIPKSAFHKNEFRSHAITVCWHKISNTQIRIQIKVSFATPRIFQICNKLHFRFLYWKSSVVHKYWTKFNKTKMRYSAMLIQTSNKVLDCPFLFFESIFALLCRTKSSFLTDLILCMSNIPFDFNINLNVKYTHIILLNISNHVEKLWLPILGYSGP